MIEDIHELLSLSDKGLSTAHNAVAKMFRSILLDLNIDRMSWDRLMREYLVNPENNIPNNPVKRSSERSNINRALCKSDVSWKMLRRAIKILNPKSIRYEVELTWDHEMRFPNEGVNSISLIPHSRQDELYAIYSNLLRDLGVSIDVWNILVGRYLDKEHSKSKDNPPDISTLRGNIRKSLLDKHSYTWNTFCKGLRILGIREAKFNIILEWPKRTTVHTHYVSIRK